MNSNKDTTQQTYRNPAKAVSGGKELPEGHI